MATLPKSFLTPEEYLAIERKAEFKSEYYNGEMFAMAGASARHGWIVLNTAGELRQQLKGKPCRVSSSDLRIQVTATGLYTYPDVVVVCGEPQYAEGQNDTLLNPVLIVEVLSDSTRDYDLGRKFQHYRSLPSLAEYLIVEQTKPHVEHWVRQAENLGLLAEYSNLTDTIRLEAIACTLPLSEIYDKIDWAAAPS
jgi:Uma2 family endonuclease